MPLKRAVAEFGKTYKDRFALRTYPGTSVPIFIFILGWSRTKPRVTLSAQTMPCRAQVHQLLSAEHATPLLVITQVVLIDGGHESGEWGGCWWCIVMWD